MLSIEEYEAGHREAVGGVVTVMGAGALEALTPTEREVAVTDLIDRAASEIQRAVDMGEPADVMAAYKDQAAAIADLTKRLDVSKDAVLNSQVLQRRAERGLGLAIRAGQEAGTVSNKTRGGDRRSKSASDFEIQNPTDFAKRSELYGTSRGGIEQTGIYALADNGTPDDFDNALDAAKEEGNVSRANVVRKLKRIDEDRRSPGVDWASIARSAAQYEFAEEARAAVAPDTSIEYFVAQCRKNGVTFTDSRKRTAAIAKSNDLLDRVTLSLEVSAQTIPDINTEYIDPESAAEALDRLTTALPVINKLMRELKKGII